MEFDRIEPIARGLLRLFFRGRGRLVFWRLGADEEFIAGQGTRRVWQVDEFSAEAANLV